MEWGPIPLSQKRRKKRRRIRRRSHGVSAAAGRVGPSCYHPGVLVCLVLDDFEDTSCKAQLEVAELAESVYGQALHMHVLAFQSCTVRKALAVSLGVAWSELQVSQLFWLCNAMPMALQS